MKVCSSCNQEKNISDFYVRTTGKPEKRCKICYRLAQASGIQKRKESNTKRGDKLRKTENLKKCSRCLEEKQYRLFSRANKNPDGHSSVCVACSRPYAKKYYEKNKSRISVSANASREASVRAKRKFLMDYYKTNPCVDCGESNPLTLQSDHINNKSHEISKLINSGYGLETLKSELEKCVVRCANCHQIKTANDFGFWRLNYV